MSLQTLANRFAILHTSNELNFDLDLREAVQFGHITYQPPNYINRWNPYIIKKWQGTRSFEYSFKYNSYHIRW